MRARKLDRPRTLDFAVLRPAIVEAKLMTAKHACDEIYVATLAEELRRIEGMIASAEQALEVSRTAESECPSTLAQRAVWFHDKSSELNRRLERIALDNPGSVSEPYRCRDRRSKTSQTCKEFVSPQPAPAS